MKKLNLQLGSIKEMLTKEQMKKVAGGYTIYYCYYYVNANCLHDVHGGPGTKNLVTCSPGSDGDTCYQGWYDECAGDGCCDDVVC